MFKNTATEEKKETKRKNKPQASLWKALTCLWLDPLHKGELWWADAAACNEYHRQHLYTSSYAPLKWLCQQMLFNIWKILNISNLIEVHYTTLQVHYILTSISFILMYTEAACLSVAVIAEVGLIHLILYRDDRAIILHSPSFLAHVRLLNSHGIFKPFRMAHYPRQLLLQG